MVKQIITSIRNHWMIRYFFQLIWSIPRDIKNRLWFGPGAPIYAETIWVNPSSVHDFLWLTPDRYYSGLVLTSSWPDKDVIPVTEVPRIRCCIEHWQNGKEWKDTGAYELILQNIADLGIPVDDCKDLTDIHNRYEKLDAIFQQIENEKRLLTRNELMNNRNFREIGGILIHIGPEGKLYFGMGAHRFAMAKILNISFPAQIGCIHISAISFLSKLRKPPEEIILE